jgi:AraC-like DNA-binding protein
MQVLIDTRDLPGQEGFARWREICQQPPVPYYLRCAQPRLFTGQARAGELGRLNVHALASRGQYEFRRPARLVSRSDPELFRLVLNISGDGGMLVGDREVPLRPGDLLLTDTSRPGGGWRGGDGTASRWIFVSFPRRLLGIPDRAAAALIGVPLPGQVGLTGLIAGFFRQAAADPGQFAPGEADRVAGIAVDLLAALVAGETGRDRLIAPEARRTALRLQARGFIERHLGDSDLTPAAVAVAHHISVRQLHRLFATEDVSVAAWIRQRRLDACRRDLADPRLGRQPVHLIAARWGLGSPAQFSRAFKQAYGVSPGEYRASLPPGRP